MTGSPLLTLPPQPSAGVPEGPGIQPPPGGGLQALLQGPAAAALQGPPAGPPGGPGPPQDRQLPRPEAGGGLGQSQSGRHDDVIGCHAA